MINNKNLLSLIGNTPLVEVYNKNKPKVKILAKLESYNLSGSIKDRMANFMVNEAEKKGQLKPGGKIIEATTGNTGIALAMIARIKGYKMTAVLPENMSLERIKLMKALGAKVILTPQSKGPLGAIEKRNKLMKIIKNSWTPDQFNNYDNVMSYKKTMVKEIVLQLKNKHLDYLVAGIGTGGTLMGLSIGLKEYFPKLKVVAVEPEESAVLSGEKEGVHNIQGIGEGFIPSLVKRNIIDQIIKISTKEAVQTTKQLIKQGFLVGFSSGANYLASLKIAGKLKKKTNILTIFPDHSNRYLSLLGKN